MARDSADVRDYRQMLKAIECLYAAAMDSSKWQTFLAAAASIFEADNAYVSQIAHDAGTLEYIVLRDIDWNAISVGRYAALMNEDPRMPAFRDNPYRPLHCRMIVSEKRLRSSRTYIEALKPLGIEYTMVVGVPDNADVTNFLGFTRDASRESFNARDCELMSEFVPHLARAFAIRRALNKGEAALTPATNLPGRESKQEMVTKLFGLTPSQARLTALLMTGRSVKEIALILSITEGTARQYLKLIFRKTGTRRQADLIRVVGDAMTQSMYSA